MNMQKLVETLAFIAALLPATVAGQEGGIFTPPDPAVGTRAAENIPPPDGITLRRRLVEVDIDRLAQARAAVAPEGAPSAELRLNLFADAVLTGIVETTSPTPSGYVLSGRIEGIAGSTLTIVVNGTVVAGTIRTAGGTWRIPVGRRRPARREPGRRVAAAAGCRTAPPAARRRGLLAPVARSADRAGRRFEVAREHRAGTEGGSAGSGPYRPPSQHGVADRRRGVLLRRPRDGPKAGPPGSRR